MKGWDRKLNKPILDQQMASSTSPEYAEIIQSHSEQIDDLKKQLTEANKKTEILFNNLRISIEWIKGCQGKLDSQYGSLLGRVINLNKNE